DWKRARSWPAFLHHLEKAVAFQILGSYSEVARRFTRPKEKRLDPSAVEKAVGKILAFIGLEPRDVCNPLKCPGLESLGLTCEQCAEIDREIQGRDQEYHSQNEREWARYVAGQDLLGEIRKRVT